MSYKYKMDYFVGLRLKFINFCKKNKKKIIIFFIIWLIVFTINMILKYRPAKIQAPSTTYKPYVTVMDDEKEVPEKYQEPINNLIDTYFNYCNNGEYEKAYNVITEDCRKQNYPTLEAFKEYVDYVFEGKKKIYNIQAYSIVDNKYIFNVRILDDIMANGTTDGYYYYEEKYVLTEENGEMKLSIAGYIASENPNIVAENDDMIIEVVEKSVDYETETYTVKVTNKTDKYIVIADNTQENEVLLDLGEQTRKPTNLTIANFFVIPNGTKTQQLVFNKFYDNNLTSQKLIFGQIRILNSYNWEQATTENDLNDAVSLYGLEVKLK